MGSRTALKVDRGRRGHSVLIPFAPPHPAEQFQRTGEENGSLGIIPNNSTHEGFVMRPPVREVVALLLALAVGSSASADMSLPGMRNAWPTHRITTRETFPNHIVVLVWHMSVRTKDEKTGEEQWQPQDEAEYVELTPNTPINVPLGPKHGRGSASLLIVSRELSAPYQTAQDLAEAVKSRKVLASVRHQFTYRESVPEWYGSEITIDYRVQRTEHGGIEFVRTTWDQGYQCCVAAVALPVAIFFGGAWMIRRSRDRRIAPRE